MCRRTAKRLFVAAVALWAMLAMVARGQLPDGRSYELASPSAKLGSDVMAESSRTRAAAGEAPGLPMAVSFASLGGFADVQGMGVGVDYLAQRTGAPGTSGWTTHAITPAQESLSIRATGRGLDPLYEGDMAPDLTAGIFRAWSPLTVAPNVQDVESLYLRSDLRAPGAGRYALLTDAAAPLAPITTGTQRPYLAAASDDFRHVLFESKLALTPDARTGNVMLYKADDGVVRLISAGAGCPGTPAPSSPCAAAGRGASALRRTTRTLSADGSRAIFTSPITFLGGVSSSPSAPSRVYQLDDHGTATTADDELLQVNASEKAVPDVPQAASFQTASRDGARVFLTSGEQLTDAPGAGLYLWRRDPLPAPGAPRRLTRIGGGAEALAIGASDDGRRVYFVASGQLLPGGPPVSEDGIYLWQDDGSAEGMLSFVGAVGALDAQTIAGDVPWNQTPPLARVTPDGATLLFETSDGAGLAPGYDHGSCPGGNANNTSNGRCSEVYVYRVAGSAPLAPRLVCASCRPDGAPATANATIFARGGSGAAQRTWHVGRALSDDGRRVFFSTAERLAPGDANGRVDAYEYDVPSGTAHLLSSGRDGDDAWFEDASASGDDVFVLTRERLVGWDVDQAYDLYDVRVGGGFAEPPAPAPGCEGDACRGPAHAAPPVAGLGSATFAGGASGSGGARRAKPCRRGQVRRRVHGKARCVKRGARGTTRARARQRKRRR